MKKYHVAAGDGKGYYGVNYESYREATELLKISQRHDPQAHIIEEEYHFTNADRIRTMTDQELARIMVQLSDLDVRIPYCQELPECEALLETDDGIPAEKCEQCMLAWLRKPAED